MLLADYFEVFVSLLAISEKMFESKSYIFFFHCSNTINWSNILAALYILFYWTLTMLSLFL